MHVQPCHLPSLQEDHLGVVAATTRIRSWPPFPRRSGAAAA